MNNSEKTYRKKQEKIMVKSKEIRYENVVRTNMEGNTINVDQHIEKRSQYILYEEENETNPEDGILISLLVVAVSPVPLQPPPPSRQKVPTLALSPTDAAVVPRTHHRHLKLWPLFLRILVISDPPLPGVLPLPGRQEFQAPLQQIPLTHQPILIAMRQDKGIANQAGKYARCLIPILFAHGLLQSILMFLQTQSIVFPMVITSALRALFHILLCWLL
ncbi:hypothetical protein S245_035598, partial [Arachis hypogaea]